MDSKYKVTYTNSENKAQPIKEKAYQESAASVSEVKPYQFGKSSSKNTREQKRWWTKLILTIFAAILLGSLFGLLMLNIFSHNQAEPVIQDSDPEPVVDQPNRVEPTETDGQIVELGTLSGYVIQAGAFQEVEQAHLARDIFSAEGYQTVIWETEADYRVFLAIYATNEAAKQVGEQFIENDFDVYAREWQSQQGTVSAADGEWLLEFQTLWQQSLADHSESVEQAWREWATIDHEELSPELEAFQQHVAQVVTQFDENQLPFTLLELLHAYDQLIE